MKTRDGKMKVRALAVAVQSVLVAMYAMPAHADGGEAAALMVPTSFLEFGGLYVSRDSAKFGEYTGLHDKGGYVIGNFRILGGDSSGGGNGTMRWSVTGTDLGLTSRSAGATVSNQGKWDLGINYDALTHYTSDTYQTPYQGSVGGNSFTLPAGFGTVANTRSMSAAQLATFHNLDVDNKRENISLFGGLNLGPQWDVKVDYNHLDQSGGKLMAFGSAAFSGAQGEKVSILPMPTDSKTDTVTASINWTGEKGHATGSYFGSFYRDNVNGVQFQTWGGANNIQTMGTYPSNDLHQFNLNGGYAFTPRTKLTGGLSYSRNTQNTAYAYDTAPMVTASPTTSLSGSVRNTHADIKLTDQTTANLLLSGSYTYNDRDNRTASNIYNSRAIDGGNIYNYPNTPLSIKRSNFELAGDYRFDMKQKFRLAYNHDEIDRKCNQYAVGGGTALFPYAPGTNCVTATNTKDDRLNASYRLRASSDINLRLDYTYSDRKSTFDQNARAAFISTDGAPGGNTGAGLITGANAGDYVGFNPYFEASRTQNLVKAGANWQATDRLSFTATGRYANDNYKQDFGVQKGTQWSLNLDASYVYRENGSVFAYVSQQERTRDVTDRQRTTATVPLPSTWTNKLKDNDTTFGLGVKQGGLMGGKLELVGDLAYSRGKTRYETAINYALATPCETSTVLTCGLLPDITSAMTQFKLSGNYQIDKRSKVALGYLYRHLSNTDFYYNGLQTGFTPNGLMPTNQQSPNYSVNVVWASYIYSFQ
jgi:MtrB/PioB family decaheme-associated outer membrane protein